MAAIASLLEEVATSSGPMEHRRKLFGMVRAISDLAAAVNEGKPHAPECECGNCSTWGQALTFLRNVAPELVDE